MSRRPDAREKVLDAAELVLSEGGLTGMTLEHVAERAGVSKGGLLYHFPSKAKLVDGLFERLADLTEAAVEAAPSDPAGVVRWFIGTSIHPSEQETSLFRALSALLRSADDLETDRLRRLFEAYAAPVREVVADPVLFETVRLTGDGLFLSRMLGLSEPDPEVLERLMDELATRATRGARG